MKKLYDLSSQNDYLNNSIANNILPKGIADQSKFTLSYSNIDLNNVINKLYQFAGSRALNLIALDIKMQVQNLKRSLFQQRDMIRTSYGEEKLNDITNVFNDYFKPFIQSLKKKHDNKSTMDCNLGMAFIPLQDIFTHPSTKPTSPTHSKNRKFKKKKSTKCNRQNRKQTINNEVKNNNAVKVNDAMILNKSNKELTVDHKELLTLGPSFAPTPADINYTQREIDLEKWANKLRWAHYFASKPNSDTTQSPSTNPHQLAEMSLLPPLNKSAPKSSSLSLELYISLVTKDLKNLKLNRKSFDNLSPNLRSALKDLTSSDDLVIRLFDKGIGWFLTTPSGYVEKVMDHLGDEETFKCIDNGVDPTKPGLIISDINGKIEQWADKYEKSGDITSKISNWVVKTDSRPGYNYCNFKVHKPESNFPGRLITSGCGSPTERLAQYSHYYLHPIADKLLFCLRDTSQFLSNIIEFNKTFEGDFNNLILATWDIVAMYPSIDNEMGLKACTDLLNERSHQTPSTECIVEATKLTLENNISFFNGNIYLQDNGTAMGPHNAPPYADNAMYPIDKIITTNKEYPIFSWDRFKDDIYSPWMESIERLHEFTEWINTLHPKIKFKLKYAIGSEGIEYLDTKIYVKNNKIQTTLYTKPSDTHAYLNPASCHPKHICMNIPKSVAHRIRRICSEDNEYFKHKEIQIKHFEDRGYNSNFVRKIFDEYDNVDRLSLIKQNPENEEPSDTGRKFPLVMDFNPNLPNASILINKYKHLLDLDPTLSNVINKDNIFVSFRKSKTLKDILVHSRYPHKPNTTDPSLYGSLNCNKCNVCKNYLVATDKVRSFTTNKEYSINQSIKCTDKYIVYVINDTFCNKQNVGCTEDTIRVRFTNHKSHIKKQVTSCRVAVHYNDTSFGHKFDRNHIDSTLPNELQVILIDKVVPEPWDTNESIFKKLIEKEAYWQNQLRSFIWEGGLNARDERTIANKKKATSHGLKRHLQ